MTISPNQNRILWVLLLSIFVAMLGIGVIAPELGRFFGMGNIMGFFNMSMSLGMIVGPILSGWILDLFGIPYVFIFVGVIEIIGTTGSVLLLSKKQLIASSL